LASSEGQCVPIRFALRTAGLSHTLAFWQTLAVGVPLPYVRKVGGIGLGLGEGSRRLPEAVGAMAGWRIGAERAGALRPPHGASPGTGPWLSAPPTASCLASAPHRPCPGDAPWRLPQGAGAQPRTRGWATIATSALPVFSTTSPDVQQVRSQPRRQAARDSSPEPSFRHCPGRKKRTNSTCATSIECGILQIVVEGA